MQALAFSAGPYRFAVPVRALVKLLPRLALRPVALAPAAVAGLLSFRGHWVPVVDVCRLVLDRDTLPQRGSRILLIAIDDEAAPRWLGLLAEQMLDLVAIERTVPGLALPDQPWLGDHLGLSPEAAQLLDPACLLPEALRRLFRRQGAGEAVA